MLKSSRFTLPLITRPTEHFRGDFRCRNQRSTNCVRGEFCSEALQKGGGLDSIRMIEIAAIVK
jgi:hypothetical protein